MSWSSTFVSLQIKIHANYVITIREKKTSITEPSPFFDTFYNN